MASKKILAIDFILVGVAVAAFGVFAFIFFSGGGLQTGGGPQLSPDFVIFELDSGVTEILVDDNIDFPNPEVIVPRVNLEMVLEPGLYYWRIESLRGAEIRQLKVVDETFIRFDVSENGNYVVMNAGGNPVRVEYSSYGEYVGTKLIGGGDV